MLNKKPLGSVEVSRFVVVVLDGTEKSAVALVIVVFSYFLFSFVVFVFHYFGRWQGVGTGFYGSNVFSHHSKGVSDETGPSKTFPFTVQNPNMGWDIQTSTTYRLVNLILQKFSWLAR